MSGKDFLKSAAPSAVTSSSLLIAFASIVESLCRGRSSFESSAWLIVLCVLLDKADGALARLLNASSRFGVQLDSLADLVAFGLAPAVLAFAAASGAGATLGPSYWIAFVSCGAYLVAAALRLARFNLLTDEYGDKFFFGFPTTLCGGTVAVVYIVAHRHLPGGWEAYLPFALLPLAFLMVSNVALPKMKARKSRWLNVFQTVNVAGAYICGAFRLLPEYLLLLLLLYLVFGGGWCLLKGIRPGTPSMTEGT